MRALRTLLLILSFTGIACYANSSVQSSYLSNAIRVIGDQLLLQSNDSTSRVLPIERDGNDYLMRFAGDVEIIPDSLVTLVKAQFSRIKLQEDYLVEVLSCDSNKVVYSYLMIKEASQDMVACKMRSLEKDCYMIKVSLSEPEFKAYLNTETEKIAEKDDANGMWFILIAASIIVVLVIAYKKRKDQQSNALDSAIKLGKFHFKPTDATLILKEERIELSMKEADLLQLLYTSLNQTVERETILNKVWGDEGDYVGRTLDVFYFPNSAKSFRQILKSRS